MLLEIFSHEYFWLSFLPITLLGAGFWVLYFDRSDSIREPLGFLCLALLAGIFSALAFVWMSVFFAFDSWSWKIFGEEFFKMFFAIICMELLRCRFTVLTQGLMYGFAVGIGFACAENLLYLLRAYEVFQSFDAGFWLTFQGRFWSTSLLHGVTTAFFGLFYAGAYLSRTLQKARNESPLRVFFVPPRLQQLWFILSFHVARKHLFFQKTTTRSDIHHEARTVVLEGFWIALCVHAIFNTALLYSRPVFAFVLAFGLMIFLSFYSPRD